MVTLPCESGSNIKRICLCAWYMIGRSPDLLICPDSLLLEHKRFYVCVCVTAVCKLKSDTVKNLHHEISSYLAKYGLLAKNQLVRYYVLDIVEKQ